MVVVVVAPNREKNLNIQKRAGGGGGKRKKKRGRLGKGGKEKKGIENEKMKKMNLKHNRIDRLTFNRKAESILL